MKRSAVCIPLLVMTLAVPAIAAPRSTVLYLDGARHTTEVSAVKGVAEVVLPAGMQEGSLRVRPLGDARIARVDVTPSRPDRKTALELERIAERKELLQDRLKALETREEIFRAAARSQSGKAPRKTKSNPEPMASIRQGTEFAIAQLEEVYRLRRRADREIAALDARLAVLRKGSGAGGSVVRVWLDAPRGAASVSWSVAGGGWRPRYEFRFDGTGTVPVSLRAGLPPGTSGAVSVAVSSLNGAAAEAVHPVKGDLGVVGSFRLPASQEQVSTTLLTTLHASVVNTTGSTLPAGDADGYWQGEYLGTLPLSAIPPEGGVELRFGTRSRDPR
jgi:hypothetical protein